MYSLLFIIVVCVSEAHGVPYILSCGSDGGSDGGGRTWVSDQRFLGEDKTGMRRTAHVQDPSLPSDIPYTTARIFKSHASYAFNITPASRYFLRLYFYPASYGPDLRISNSYFSVTANDVVLMTNFSASISATAFTQAYIVREFSLSFPRTRRLLLSFSPASAQAFAFVNGIELREMPTDLFAQSQAVMVGTGKGSGMDTSAVNFQTMYRLNVGGPGIDMADDDVGGLARTWYNDFAYLDGAGTGVTGVASDQLASVQIRYGRNVPHTVAPLKVYETQRSTGAYKAVSSITNLTWSFWVDPDSTYLVRFHFCENRLMKVNQRVFDIFVNDQLAQPSADILAWTEIPRVATFKDYIVGVVGPETSLRVQLSPTLESTSEFIDSNLNGLEIFKMSDKEKGFASPNPNPSQMVLDHQEDIAIAALQKYNDQLSKKNRSVAIAGGFALCVLLALSMAVTKSTTSNSNPSQIQNNNIALCRNFSLSDMKHATNNFHESNVIGAGGFGKVYRGVIDEKTKVAIKRSNPGSQQGEREFHTEIKMLSQLRHKHLVSLIGFCDEAGEMCLVYDYMSRGTMREHLYMNKGEKVRWEQRLEMCVGAARGLHYLHTGATHTIIHRDVKTTNILVSHDWVPKVSDFGLSRWQDVDMSHVSTMVKGSFGYLDPEYFKTQKLTVKSDVYSFGVVLLEALCGRQPLNPGLPKEEVSLAEWALRCQRMEEIVDPRLKGEINAQCMQKFTHIAHKCLAQNAVQRPNMGEVLWNLELALHLQQNNQNELQLHLHS